MNFEPQRFFIGLMDFFSILLPGALLTYVLMDLAGPLVLGSRYPLEGAQGVAVFLVSSYLFGHFAFLLGSWLDEIYDVIRKKTLNNQITLLAKRGRLMPWWQRRLATLLFKRESDIAVERVGRIKRARLASLHSEKAVNNFQWSKALLAIESPDCFIIVQRAEADSKFFRCLVVVLVVLAITWSVQRQWLVASIAAALIPLAMWRYMELRFKATNQAYWSVITLFGRDGTCKLESPGVAPVPSHAGGVVYRTRRGKTSYLLVEASKDPNQWVLPKGHREEGEEEREAAVREVREEAGVWARPETELARVALDVSGAPVTVQFYLMKYLARTSSSDPDRKRLWLPLDQAVKKASYIESRALLEAADQQRRRAQGVGQ